MSPSRSLLIIVILVLLLAALLAAIVLITVATAVRPSEVATVPRPQPASATAGAPPAAPPSPGPAASGPLRPAAPVPGGAIPTDASDPAGLPQADRPLLVLDKAHFTIGYDPRWREPAWVSYALGGPIRNHGHEKRPDRFEPDAGVPDSPRHEDYSRSGFDRGHMCPAYAEFSRFGPEGMRETFITTNICPQLHALNAGRWEDLEALIAGRESSERHHGHHDEAPAEEAEAEPPSALSAETERLLAGGGWAAEYGQVFVTDGPEPAEAGTRLRAGEMVPTAFFMILLRQEKDGHYRSLAFEMPNQAVTAPLESFLVPISAIERRTGLRFLQGLPGDQQEALKAEAAHRLW